MPVSADYGLGLLFALGSFLKLLEECLLVRPVRTESLSNSAVVRSKDMSQWK